MSIFLEFFKKNWFLTIYTHISKDGNSVKIVWLARFFTTGSGDLNLIFFFLFFLKIMRRKCETEFRGGHLVFLGAILDWQWLLFILTLYSIHGNDDLYRFWCFNQSQSEPSMHQLTGLMYIHVHIYLSIIKRQTASFWQVRILTFIIKFDRISDTAKEMKRSQVGVVCNCILCTYT